MKKRIFSLSGKLILRIVIFSILLCLATSYIGYRQFTYVMENMYNENTYEISKTALTYIDGNTLTKYRSNDDVDNAYLATQSKLDSLTNTTDCMFIFAAIFENDNYDMPIFIYDSLSNEMISKGAKRFDIGYSADIIDESFKKIIVKAMTSDEIVDENNSYSYVSASDFGFHSYSGVPIYDSASNKVGYLVVEKQMEGIASTRIAYIRYIFRMSLFVLCIFLLLYYVFLRRTLLKPIEIITKEAENFADKRVSKSGNLDMKIKNNDEIGILAGSISKMENDIVDYIENITKITTEKERISAELNVASRIQQDMLPCIFPPFPDRSEFDLYASMNPAKEVGGDFYDFFLVDHDHLALIIADVSGKGVPASLFMVITKTLLKNAAQSGLSPKAIFEKVNNQLVENNEADMFVTVWMGILTISSGRMICANAGHEYPCIRRGNGQYELLNDKHGFVLAGMEDSKYREYEIELSPGDRMFVYTDGVAEATNSVNELFGTDRMLNILNRKADITPSETIDSINEGIDEFVKETPQFDDITMISLEYNGSSMQMNGEKHE